MKADGRKRHHTARFASNQAGWPFRRVQCRPDSATGYSALMSDLGVLRLFLVGFAIGGTLYACVGSGVFSREQSNWWGDLPQHKKIVFSTAVAATVLQTFL